MSAEYKKGNLGLAICIGFGLLIVFNILLGWIPFVGWIIAGLAAGFFAGLIARGGAKHGAKAGFGSGIIGAVILLILVLFLSGLIGSIVPIGGAMVAGTGGFIVMIVGLINSIFPTIGGALGGYLRRGEPIRKDTYGKQYPQAPPQPQQQNYQIEDSEKKDYTSSQEYREQSSTTFQDGSDDFSQPSTSDNEEMIPCPNCGNEDLASHYSCKHCGNPIAGTCDECGAKYRKGTVYCHNCGNKVSEGDELQEINDKIEELKSKKEPLEKDLGKHESVLDKAEERLAEGEIDQETFNYIKEKREKKIDDIKDEVSEYRMEIEELTIEKSMMEEEEDGEQEY